MDKAKRDRIEELTNTIQEAQKELAQEVAEVDPKAMKDSPKEKKQELYQEATQILENYFQAIGSDEGFEFAEKVASILGQTRTDEELEPVMPDHEAVNLLTTIGWGAEDETSQHIQDAKRSLFF